ncbi:helix-turn-helix domain-containing protein [Lampropedia puyangensis]|uniref:Helix-turn-helix domain-containing protein n=1 Tax=Lampropedia puyangensis TaxID=1330072 RepID=A0A4S8F5X2_9BURK|nr:helix-turn-helix domain-containing protein [Lampropedia puyangensis]THU02820.1 helix-turn-helix domain-containing protein [Lampropedia puyangensis]
MKRHNSPTASPSSPATALHRVVCIAYQGAMSLDITGPMQVFATANDMRKKQGLAPFYDLTFAGLTASPVTLSCGLQIVATHGIAQLSIKNNSTILIPGGDGIEVAQHDASLRAWVQRVAPRVQRLGSICSGALVLARAGLLDGLSATTHWCRLPELSALARDIHIEGDRLHTYDASHPKHAHIFTSAGVTSGIDLAISLVEADLGRAMALAVARQLVMFVRRPGGQAQFSPLLAAETRHAPRLAKLLEWIPSRLGDDLGVEQLSIQACLPPRTLARVFQQELGTSPAKYVERVRLEAASALLSQPHASIATVARLCGFGHPENLRRSFHKTMAISPQAFAERFGMHPPS